MKLLLVEDNPTAITILKEMIRSFGYDVSIAANGKEALELFEEHNFPVVITDLHMPEMSGQELIEKIQAKEPIIIVQTVDEDINKAVEIMKSGVYDYIVKPVQANYLKSKLEKAFEVYELRKIKKSLNKQRELRIQKQRNWNLWKETIVFRDSDRFDESLFDNLKTCLSQGHGFGGLLSLVDSLPALLQKEGDHFILDKDVFDLLQQNSKVSYDALNTFQYIVEILHENFNYKKTSVADIFELLKDTVKNIEPYREIKGQVIQISEQKIEGRSVRVDSERIARAYFELLHNALKFSSPQSNILVFIRVTGENLTLSILNDIPDDFPEEELLNQESSRMIFEPFYRHSRSVKEQYKSLDYGLGLTIVDKIARRHGGQVSVYAVNDHVSDKKERKISFDFELPVFDTL